MKKLLMFVVLVALTTNLLAQCSSSKVAETKETATLSAAQHAPAVYAVAGTMGARDGGDHHSHAKDIVATAVANGNFKTLATALNAAGLVDALQGKGPFTVFAPTDEAFAKLPKGTVANLLKPENKARLTQILTYHVAAGALPASAVTKASGTTTLNGQRLSFDTSHGVKVGNATVVSADVMASNGVIHVIDTVLLPTENNLVETAVSAGDFGTLVTAVKAAGLANLLSGDGPFTVFAPTDEAFAKLPAGTVENLLKPQNKHKLVEILKLHVVPGRVFAEDAAKVGSTKAASGGSLAFAKAGKGLKVNDAGIVVTDVQATNGVIHVIDSVLLPQ